MDLDKRMWYVSWYFLSLAVIDEFFDERGWRTDRYNSGTNLCSFGKVILVWAPTIFLLNVLVYAGLIFVLTYLPIHLFGLTGYGWIIGAIVALIAIVWLASAITEAFNRANSRRFNERINKQSWERSATKLEEPEDKGPSFVAVMWGYLVAAKQRVCPMINFK